MGCAAGDDLDQADLVEMPKTLHDVLVKAVEVFKRLREEAMPEASRLGIMFFARLGEIGFVFLRGDNLAGQVVGKLCNEDGVRELFQQNGRKIEIAVEADLIALKVFQHPQ